MFETSSIYTEYISKKHPVYYHKGIIYYFIYLKNDELCDDFTKGMYNILKNAILSIKDYLKDDSLTNKEKYYLEISIEEGNKILENYNIQ